MNFNINLATKVYVDFRKVNICFAIAGVVVAFWLMLSIYTAVNYAAEMQKLTDYKAKLSHGTNARKVSEKEYTAFLANLKNVNSILYKRSFDWLLLFANLEQLVPEGVALREVVPADKGAVVRLSGSARSFSAVRRFIENLESSKTFGDIYLTSHTALKDGPQKGITFSVTCKAMLL